jgi:hypothetical protein
MDNEISHNRRSTREQSVSNSEIEITRDLLELYPNPFCNLRNRKTQVCASGHEEGLLLRIGYST